MRYSSLLLSSVAFAAAAVAAFGAAVFMVSRIEHTSQSEIETLFRTEQLEWASVDVDGLQVRLTGTAPSEATRFRAVTLAGQVVDATLVIDSMQVDPGRPLSVPDFSIEILRNDDGISLIGLVPETLDRLEIAVKLQEIAGQSDVTDLMEAADYAVPQGWDAALAYAMKALGRLPRSKISVAPGRVGITAISDSAEQKRTLESWLKKETPAGLNVAIDISAPRPVITPFTLRFALDSNGGRFDACSAHTAAGRAKILAAAAEAGLQGAADCRIGLGVPSPRWPDAVTLSIGALARLGGGSLTISDADITLVALPGADQGTFDNVVGELEADLPEVFSLHAVLPEPVRIDGTGDTIVDGTPEFVATLSPEGLLQLRGRMADERMRSAVEGFARARFSTADVRGTMRIAEGLPTGWPGRVFSGLEAMSHLTNGSLVVQPDFLELRGDTSDPDAKSDIARILGDQLGNAENFEIDVAYHEILSAEDDRMSPQECVDAINAVLKATKITFAPGSADMEGSAGRTINQIAEIMRDCYEVPMEIAGHTDSQGRESMNLGLSQRRAEAVLEALMARRVLTTNLSAKGYGEANPIADNGTEEGREDNRRIEFTLLDDGTEDEAATAEEESAAEGSE